MKGVEKYQSIIEQFLKPIGNNRIANVDFGQNQVDN
jgi:hypothetical protein